MLEHSLQLIENRSDGGKTGLKQKSEEMTLEAQVGETPDKNGCIRCEKKKT